MYQSNRIIILLSALDAGRRPPSDGSRRRIGGPVPPGNVSDQTTNKQTAPTTRAQTEWLNTMNAIQ